MAFLQLVCPRHNLKHWGMGYPVGGGRPRPALEAALCGDNTAFPGDMLGPRAQEWQLGQEVLDPGGAWGTFAHVFNTVARRREL